MTLFTTPDVSNGNVSRRRRRTAEPRPQAISIKILENLVFEICLQRDTQTYVHTDMSIQTRSWQQFAQDPNAGNSRVARTHAHAAHT